MQSLGGVIAIQGLRVAMHLGVSREERALRQPVEIDMRLFPRVLPAACEDDALERTFCYDGLCQRLRHQCETMQVKLLERLAAALHETMRQATGDTAWVWLRVTKCRPPVEGLRASQVIVSDVPAEVMARYMAD